MLSLSRETGVYVIENIQATAMALVCGRAAPESFTSRVSLSPTATQCDIARFGYAVY
jgi:hypothetical protein